MKIHINFNNFESKQNGTMDIDIDAADILDLVKHLVTEENKRREQRAKERAEELKMETSSFEVPLNGRKPRA